MPCLTRRFRAVLAITLAAPIASAQPVSPVEPITNIDGWARIARAPATRPLDIVFIAGDSTIVVNGGGQARGVHEALGALYPAFATAFVAPGFNDGSGAGLNMGWDCIDAGGDSQTGASGPFDDIFQRTASTPLVFNGHYTRYGHVSSPFSPSVLYGGQLGVASHFDLRRAIRFQVWYAAGPGLGSFTPQIRHNFDGIGSYQSLSTGLITGPVPASWPQELVKSYSVTLPADPARSAIRNIYWNIGGNLELWLGASPPVTFYGVRAYAEDARRGYAVTIADQCGGESDYGLAIRARDWLERGALPPLRRSPSYQLLIGALRDRQIAMGYEPRILLIIQGMLNSATEPGLSINQVAPNHTAEGVLDNLTDIHNRWEKFRIRAGYSPDEFAYAFVGCTLFGDDAGAEVILGNYRRTVADWTRGRPHTHFIDWTAFMTAQEAAIWAGPELDWAHLSIQGYKTIWRRAFDHGINHDRRLKIAGD